MKSYLIINSKKYGEIHYGKLDKYYFIYLNKRDFNIIEYFINLVNTIKFNYLIVFTIDSSFVSKKMSDRMKIDGIKHSFFKYGLIINPKYILKFIKIYFSGEPGGITISFLNDINDLNLNVEILGNSGLLDDTIFEEYKIQPYFKKYLEQYNPIFTFSDLWHNQQIVTMDNNIYQKTVDYFKVENGNGSNKSK